MFSATLPAVVGSARSAARSVAEEVERLRAELDGGDIAIGGAGLAAAAAVSGPTSTAPAPGSTTFTSHKAAE